MAYMPYKFKHGNIIIEVPKVNELIKKSDITWANVLNKPSSFTPSSHNHDWSSITGKPSSFAPSSHTHSYLPLLGGSLEGNVIMKNGLAYRGYNTSGVSKVLVSLTSSNNVCVGASETNLASGDTNVYGGNIINLYANRLSSSYKSHGLEFRREQSGSYRTVLRPAANGSVYLGTDSLRFNTAFFSNSITASDLKEKEVIEDFDFKVKDFILRLKPIAYHRIGEGDTGVRIHLGFGAQTVYELIKTIDLGDLSLVRATIVKNVETIKIDDNGKEYKKIEQVELPYKGEKVDDNDLVWGLNYNEFIAPMVLMIQHQQKEIDDLKKQVQELKNLILNKN